MEEPRLADEQATKQRAQPQLFGTLIASKPTGSRSPLALAIAVVLHVVLLFLLVVVSRPFIPKLAHKIFEPIAIVPEEETDILPFLRGTPPPPPPAPPVAANRGETTSEAAEFVTPAGPITPLSEVPVREATPEPSDRGINTGPTRSLAERLRPTTIDPRLSPAGSYILPGVEPVEAVRERIAQSLDAYNDSVATEADARRRALDWTLKTKDGKQWGVGPDGKIHLGGITLPVPIAFNPPPGKRDEINARNRAYAEIEAQANREIGRQSFKDRVKAIRARKDKEREEKKKAGEAPITN